jgi:hypothetical protein
VFFYVIRRLDERKAAASSPAADKESATVRESRVDPA